MTKSAVEKQVTQLCNWYAKFKPEGGKVIQVNCTGDDLDFCMKNHTDGTFWFQGRQIVPIAVKPASKAVVSRRKGFSMSAVFKEAVK